MKKLIIGLTLAVFAAGCAGVDGEWVTKDELAGASKDSTMTLEPDGQGKAKLYFGYAGSQVSLKYDVDWKEKDNGDIDIDLECDDSNCGADADFSMECSLDDSGDEMDCDADGAFADVDFEWQRDEQ